MDPKTRLLSAFEELKQALLRCDSEALRENIAEDYRGVDPDGRHQDRGIVLEAYGPGGVRLDAYEVEELETRIIGAVGIVTGKGRIHGEYGDAEFEHLVRFVDVYVDRGGSWRLYYSQVTPLKTA